MATVIEALQNKDQQQKHLKGLGLFANGFIQALRHLILTPQAARSDLEHLDDNLSSKAIQEYMAVVSEGTTTKPSVDVWQQFIPEMAKINGNNTILYLGAGNGELARYLTREIINYRQKMHINSDSLPQIICVDINEQTTKSAEEKNREYTNIESVAANVFDLPEELQRRLRDAKLVIDFNLLHHLQNQDEELHGSPEVISSYFRKVREICPHASTISIEPKNGPAKYIAAPLAGAKGTYRGLKQGHGLRAMLDGVNLAHDTFVSYGRTLTLGEKKQLEGQIPGLTIKEQFFYRIYSRPSQ